MTEEVESKETALVVLPDVKNALVYFGDKGLDPIIEKIKTEVKAFQPDISTVSGRKAIASMARKVASAKVRIDDLGKELVGEMKKTTTAIDEERRRMREELDKLRDDVRAPLTEWETKEETRVAGHEAQLAAIQDQLFEDKDNPTAEEIRARITAVNARSQDRDWQEFAARAAAVKETILAKLTRQLDAREKADVEKAELERLRQAEEDRKRKENEERIAREAAEEATRQAEAKAAQAAAEEAERVRQQQEADRLERERVERERQEAIDRAEKAEKDRIAAEQKAEADKIAAAEKAEADRKAAEEKAERERKEAADKAERDKQAAVEAERKRADDQRLAEEAEAKRRADDTAHRTKINNEALDALLSVIFSDDPAVLTEAQRVTGREVVKAIALGQIPHIKITY